MLKITEIKAYIAKGIERFNEAFIGFEVPKIVVVSESRRQAVRAKVLQECGAEYKDDSRDTEGEVIDGLFGKQILLYQCRLKTERQVYHTLWHEFGHIIFGNEKQYGIELNVDTPMRSGYAVFNEFMAEYIAYVVTDGKGFGVYNPNMYLQMAFQEERNINPYWLSRYMAIIVGDSTVPDEFVADGAKYVSSTVWGYLAGMFDMIDEQLQKRDFWKATSEFIEDFGCLYDDMFSAVYRGL